MVGRRLKRALKAEKRHWGFLEMLQMKEEECCFTREMAEEKEGGMNLE